MALFENLPLGLRRLVLDLGSTASWRRSQQSSAPRHCSSLKDVVAALPALSERLCRMRGLRELELHLDHTDMGTPELKLLGKSFSLSTLKRLCLDLRSCYNLKQDCRLNLNSRSCTQKNTPNQSCLVETQELGNEDNRHFLYISVYIRFFLPWPGPGKLEVCSRLMQPPFVSFASMNHESYCRLSDPRLKVGATRSGLCRCRIPMRLMHGHEELSIQACTGRLAYLGPIPVPALISTPALCVTSRRALKLLCWALGSCNVFA